MSHLAPPAALMFMADMRGRVLLALVLAAPLTVGCMVRTHSGRVPPGQIRRAEVHDRNAARKAERNQGNKHGHHQARGRGHGR